MVMQLRCDFTGVLCVNLVLTPFAMEGRLEGGEKNPYIRREMVHSSRCVPQNQCAFLQMYPF